jgi:hypothetical protein
VSGSVTRTFGADFVADRILIARRISNGAQAIIDEFIDIGVSELDSALFGADDDLYFSVSEDAAVIKKVTITPENGLTPDQLASFELASSLLDGPSEYYLESFESGQAAERLAIAYRRSLIDEKVRFLRERLVRPAGFMLRSVALARGYTYFCTQKTDGVVCLIDISCGKVSYCFLGNGRPFLMGALEDTYQVADIKQASRAFVMDLAAVLRYRMNFLAKTENRALSYIFISGQRANPEVASMIEQFIHVRTALPEMICSLFTDSTLPGAEKNLVSLGLTVGKQCE